MPWIWQHPDWPRFTWDRDRLARAEERFLVGGGVLVGLLGHLDEAERRAVAADALCEEALTTSEIEGEFLDRASVRSSIRRQLGLDAEARRAPPAEAGIAELMVALHADVRAPLDEDTLGAWHAMVMRGRRDLADVGRYRTGSAPMQVVSGRLDARRVHFEAPPSARVPAEMDAFLEWLAATASGTPGALPALTRAGVAHLHFESIHPFEDGNGRLGRAISEKLMAQAFDLPAPTALAATILSRQREYYARLEAANKRLEIGEWLAWFAGIALQAQRRARGRVEFLLDQTRLLDRLRDDLNARQQKVLLRMLREGPEGFAGGLSAGNYATIARTSPATATRDLGDLVAKGALARTGERRHARYHLTVPLHPTPRVTVDEAGQVVVDEPEPVS